MLKNLGSMLIYGIFLIAIIGFTILIRKLSDKYQLIRKIYNFLSQSLFFNVTLRSLMGGFMEYSLTSIMNFVKVIVKSVNTILVEMGYYRINIIFYTLNINCSRSRIFSNFHLGSSLDQI